MVENAFGRLKRMWLILESTIWHPNLEMLSKIILCYYVLHNMALDIMPNKDDTCEDAFFENGVNISTNELADPTTIYKSH